VLCCALLRYTVLRCAGLCQAWLRWASLCYAVKAVAPYLCWAQLGWALLG